MFEAPQVDSALKVIDFGRSTILQYNRQINALAGSFYYSAPEVLSGGEYNEQCDMWSCGVVMYLMLTGHLPFIGDMEKIRQQIKRGIVDYSGTIRE